MRVFTRAKLLRVLLLLASFSFTSSKVEANAPLIAQQPSYSGMNVSELIFRTNIDRYFVGLPDVQRDEMLTMAAQQRAQQIATTGDFSHCTPPGVSCGHVMQAGAQALQSLGAFQPGRYYGENIAILSKDTPVDALASVAATAWTQSPEHYANIINPNYNYIGIGYAQAHGILPYDENGPLLVEEQGYVIVQVFGS